MLRKLGLAGAVLGTALSLALPVSGLAMERNGRNDGESGYSRAEGTRGYAIPTSRIRFNQSSHEGVRSDRSKRGLSDSRIRYSRQNTDRGSENPGSRISGARR